MASKVLKTKDDKVVGNSSNKTNETVINLSKNNQSRNLMHVLNIGAIEKLIFLTLNAKKALNYLRLVFIKALILPHFDLENYIWIKTNISSYIISGMLS